MEILEVHRQLSVPAATVTTATTATTATTPSTTSTLSSPSTDPSSEKLSVEDKDRVTKMYASFDACKMWKLSSGKVVEEQMAKLAQKAEYEQ